jgi:hypothetical protein
MGRLEKRWRRATDTYRSFGIVGVSGCSDHAVCGVVQRLFGQDAFARLDYLSQAKTYLAEHGDFASKQRHRPMGLDVGEEKETQLGSLQFVFDDHAGDNVRDRANFGLAAVGGCGNLPSNEPSEQFLLLADSRSRIAPDWRNFRPCLGDG